MADISLLGEIPALLFDGVTREVGWRLGNENFAVDRGGEGSLLSPKGPFKVGLTYSRTGETQAGPQTTRGRIPIASQPPRASADPVVVPPSGTSVPQQAVIPTVTQPAFTGPVPSVPASSVPPFKRSETIMQLNGASEADSVRRPMYRGMTVDQVGDGSAASTSDPRTWSTTTLPQKNVLKIIAPMNEVMKGSEVDDPEEALRRERSNWAKYRNSVAQPGTETRLDPSIDATVTRIQDTAKELKNMGPTRPTITPISSAGPPIRGTRESSDMNSTATKIQPDPVYPRVYLGRGAKSSEPGVENDQTFNGTKSEPTTNEVPESEEYSHKNIKRELTSLGIDMETVDPKDVRNTMYQFEPGFETKSYDISEKRKVVFHASDTANVDFKTPPKEVTHTLSNPTLSHVKENDLENKSSYRLRTEYNSHPHWMYHSSGEYCSCTRDADEDPDIDWKKRLRKVQREQWSAFTNYRNTHVNY